MIYRAYYKKRSIYFIIFLHILVSIIPVFGITFLYVNLQLWIGMLLCFLLNIVGLLMVGSKGILVDLQNERYMHFNRFLLWDIGQWKVLPTIKRLVFKRTDEFIDTTYKHSWRKTGYRRKIFIVALLNSDIGYKLLIKSLDRREASEFGKSLAKALNLEFEGYED